jgi:hypothetical protein
MATSDPAAGHLTRDQAEELSDLADAVLAEHHRGNGAIDPAAIARAKNLKLVFGHYRDAFDGMLRQKGGRFSLFCNLDRAGGPTTRRARFTLAHELGHYFITGHRNALLSGVTPSHPSFCEFESKLFVEQQADTFASIRLPSDAFKREGTAVVADILFLRKRVPGQPPNHAGDWLTTAPLEIDGTAVPVNRYFHDHPEMVLGTWSAKDTLYPLGTYRGLPFGVELHPGGAADVYLEGEATRDTTLSRESRGARAVLNALARLAAGYPEHCDRVRQELAVGRSQLSDYQGRLGRPFPHAAHIEELSSLRDQLRLALSDHPPEGASAADLAGQVTALRAGHAVEAATRPPPRKPAAKAVRPVEPETVPDPEMEPGPEAPSFRERVAVRALQRSLF